MPGSYQLLLIGKSADPDLYTMLSAIEVEESMDLPAALELHVPVSRSAAGDLSFVPDARFAPLVNVAVVATPPTLADTTGLGIGGAPPVAQCIFDGYVLSHKLHLERGTTDSSLAVWAQDATWLMNLTERARE